MSLSQLLAALWFIFIGLTMATIYVFNNKFLGLWALGTGIVWLIEGYHPITIYTRR